MSISTLLSNMNQKCYNGFYYASISAFISIPAGGYLTEYVLKKLNLQKCKETRKALHEQFNMVISFAIICGYIYGYNMDTKQKKILN